MPTNREETGGPARRQVLCALAGGVAATALSGVATADGDEDAPTSEKTFYVVQGDRKFAVTPLKGTETPTAFYDWGLDTFSSKGTVDLQRPGTSIVFLYEAPDGHVYLVLVHGKYDGGGDADWEGGSVTFEFLGLPTGSEWLVQDDKYDGASNYDRWATGGSRQTVDWTFDAGATDGGVYGPLGADPHLRIDPAFNEAAALYEQYYVGDIDEWQLLSGPRADPDRYTLDTTESINLLQNPAKNRDDADRRERENTEVEVEQEQRVEIEQEQGVEVEQERERERKGDAEVEQEQRVEVEQEQEVEVEQEREQEGEGRGARRGNRGRGRGPPEERGRGRGRGRDSERDEDEDDEDEDDDRDD